MAKLTGAEMFEKYRRNLVNSAPDMKRGVETTTKSQTGNAIKSKQLMIDNHRAAIERGDWEKGLKAAGDEKWKKNYIEKGLPKIGAGVDAAKSEMIQTMQKVADVGDMVSNEIDKMPKGSHQDSLSRVETNMRLTKEAWGKTV